MGGQITWSLQGNGLSDMTERKEDGHANGFSKGSE